MWSLVIFKEISLLSIKAFIDKNEISLNNNQLHILYHIIYCIVSSIKAYDLMMA